MNTVKAIVDKVEVGVSKYLVPVLEQPIIHLLISWFIIINVLFGFNDLPSGIKMVFVNPFTKWLAIFVGLYYATNSFVLALSGSIIAVIIVYLVIKYVPEGFKLIDLTPTISPQCSGLTVKDLVDLYSGDVDSLKKSMYSHGIPLDIELTDTNAPLIGTYFINRGVSIGKCSPPM